MPTPTCDILILSNGPGEVTTWVRPVVQALRDKLGPDPAQVRISLALSPCPNATGNEVAIARRYPEIDRVQGASDFFPFLLFGKTADQWNWRDRGLVLFLGGDQIYPVIIGKRLGYRTLVYAEWDARWLSWVDQFAVMTSTVQQKSAPKFKEKLTVVGDLMAEVGTTEAASRSPRHQVGLLPGSKPAKLAQGVPLMLAIARHLHQQDPTIRFVIPVAPTLDLATLARFADPEQNAIAQYFGSPSAQLVNAESETPYLLTPEGIRITLHTDFPAYDLLSQCQICLTTVGANTAELGSLAVPMLVLLPTQQLDAMRAWDGIPGLLANLPGIGTLFAKAINAQFLKKKWLLAWPNIWAGEEIVPELLGDLQPEVIAAQVWHYLEHPEDLEEMRDRLRQVRGTPGASKKIADLAQQLLAQ
ncbi:MAG: lipid-A-disaccharide synthase [Cyanobacteria bacterium J06638_20]